MKSFFLNLAVYLILLWLFLNATYFAVVEVEEQRCSLTYMWEHPSFQRHFPNIKVSESNQWYGLYHYAEGYHDVDLKGIPVLFIPGNSGSYRQVRSLASVSLRMSLKIKNNKQFFDYFTVDLNEELSALSAKIIVRQVAYIKECLSYISSKYGGHVPIVIIGHSMGGFIARAVVAQSHSKVVMILSLASPLKTPIVSLDKDMATLYKDISRLWTMSDSAQQVVQISLTGGSRDSLVWDGYGRIYDSNYSLWLPTFSVKDVLVSTDHLCITWCRELIISIIKALHDSLAFDPPPSPSKLFSNFQNHLKPQLPHHAETNISVYNYHSLLLFPSVISLPHSHSPLFVISLPALSSPSRPLRLKVDTHDCINTGTTKAALFTLSNGHLHHYNIRQDAVLLSVAEGTVAVSPARLQLHLSAGCRYTITVYASFVDLAAQIFKIHLIRMPSFLSSLIILSYVAEHSVIPMSIFLTLCTVFISSCLDFFSDYAIINLYSKIELTELTVIFLLCLPILWTFSTISTIINVFFTLLPSLHHSKVLAIFVPLLGIVSSTFSPLGYLAVLLIHLLSLNRVRHIPLSLTRQSWAIKDNVVTMTILFLFLLELPALVSDFHSQRQHYSTTNIFSKEVSKLIQFECYSLPTLSLVVVTVAIFMRISGGGTDLGESSTFFKISSWLTSIVIASCSILFSIADISNCTNYLVGAMLLFETCTLFRSSKK